MQTELKDQLSDELLFGRLARGGKVTADAEDALVFRFAEARRRRRLAGASRLCARAGAAGRQALQLASLGGARCAGEPDGGPRQRRPEGCTPRVEPLRA